MGRKLTAQQIAGATEALAEQQLNIDGIRRLTGRIPLDEKKGKRESLHRIFGERYPKDREELQSQLMQLSASLGMDSFQQDNMYRRMRRLICFDMDSTLIETEGIDELAIRAGGRPSESHHGKSHAWRNRLLRKFQGTGGLLKGLDESVMRDIAEHLLITEGVERLMFVPKRYGYKIAICRRFHVFRQLPEREIGIDMSMPTSWKSWMASQPAAI